MKTFSRVTFASLVAAATFSAPAFSAPATTKADDVESAAATIAPSRDVASSVANAPSKRARRVATSASRATLQRVNAPNDERAASNRNVTNAATKSADAKLSAPNTTAKLASPKPTTAIARTSAKTQNVQTPNAKTQNAKLANAKTSSGAGEKPVVSVASSTRLASATTSTNATTVSARAASAPAVSDDVTRSFLLMNARPQNASTASANASATTSASVKTFATPILSPTKTPNVSSSASATPNGATPKPDAKTNGIKLAKANLPQVSTKKIDAPRRDPAVLGSRHKDRILLAQLEADLSRAQRGLDRADATLSEGQKQLMKVGTTMRRAMLEAGPDAKGLHPFVRVAMRYAGTPYVWGGESRSGFDCSGFIIVVMRDLGYRALPHSAAEQFNYGTPVAQELLKPGDIVFFKNTYKRGVSHVGIYLGRRRFIEAAGTGKGTIVSSLDSPYFREHYAGARRLVRG